ncbi:MAG: acyltransferase [Mesorhizobium sp.]
MDNTSSAVKKSTQRFHFVDGLRGFAAMWVVLFHAKFHLTALMAMLPGVVNHSIFIAGENGVAVFFVLSGFVIAYSVRNAPNTFAFLARFALRRSVRLDPPYWASMVVVGIFAFISARVTHTQIEFPGWYSVAVHMAYMQELLGVKEINTVYWTLTYEIQFYIIYILCRNIAPRIGPAIWILMFLVAIAWGSGLVHENIVTGLFVNKWYAFFLGVLAFHAREDGRVATALFILAAACSLGSVISGELFQIATAITAMVLYLAITLDRMSDWLNWRWIQFLGLISYSLYLTHNPVTGASFYVWKKLFGESPLSEFAGLFFVIAVCIVFAAGFWWTFERFSIRLARELATPSGSKVGNLLRWNVQPKRPAIASGSSISKSDV